MTVRYARSWVVAAVLGTVVAGCGFQIEQQPTAIDVEESDTGGANEGAPRTERETVWFVRDDLLVTAVRRLAAPVTPIDVGEVLAVGVTPAESEGGLRSAIPDATMLVSVVVSGGTAVVALSREFLDIPGGDQVLALGQIVHTMTDLRGVGRVRFEIDGSAVAVPLPEGTSSEDSVSRDDYSALRGSP